MKSAVLPFVLLCTLAIAAPYASIAAEEFPPEIVNFTPYQGNPVFAGTGKDTWDQNIRERGFILREGDTYHLWYSGYNKDRTDEVHLGYATSPDGLVWTRHKGNPIFDQGWVEDVFVLKRGGTYYMLAEGRNDIAHLMTSLDRVHWRDHGRLDIRMTSGKPISPGPFGTPTLWVEDGTWNLFYERDDLGIWLARSADGKIWTNVQDDPVIALGPEPYDRYAVALNQIVKHQGRYYAFYHATAYKPWRDWTSCVAMSTDLVHWKKYPKNPIVSGDKSSPILVPDGEGFRLYTMHPDVRVYFRKP
jgi:beta-1,2-mannobiose phosphorylase / 1,2-beta-oligomannan phosphorylase